MSAPSRLAGVDALKALGSQLIVLHHLAFYGPMSDIAYPLAPALMDWLRDYARMAVQLFLVVGGFLAARSLAPDGLPRFGRPLGMTLARRYDKLAVPFAVATALSIAAAAVARQWMAHDSIPGPPSWLQWLAHLALLQDVLGVDALTAGAWYVAIDLQLFAMLLVALGLARWTPASWRATVATALVTAMACASLWWFNRDAGWDAWGCYFFGAYGMGVLACWSAVPRRARWLLPVLGVLAVSALAIDFRARIAVAASTAFGLAVAHRCGVLDAWPRGAAVATMARISYSVFLVHFPVCLLTNAAMSHLAPAQPGWQLAGMALAWAASNVAGAVFHRHVESADLVGVWRSVLRGRAARVTG